MYCCYLLACLLAVCRAARDTWQAVLKSHAATAANGTTTEPLPAAVVVSAPLEADLQLEQMEELDSDSDSDSECETASETELEMAGGSTPPPYQHAVPAALPVATQVAEEWDAFVADVGAAVPGSPPVYKSFQYRPPPIQPAAAPMEIVWGRGHPQFKDKDARKVHWSVEETAYVTQWLDENGDRPNTLAKCLAHMRTDKQAIWIFHPHHTLNSGRLQHIKRKIEAHKQAGW
jgi:hypothetical protein